MKFLFGSIGAFALGTLGWWLGAFLGFAGAIILGAIGSGAGLHFGRRLFEEWLG